MFFITDQNGVIQDISSRQENLSRGYNFEDHKVWTEPNMYGATIGDTYREGLFYIDIDRLAAEQLRNDQQVIIATQIRSTAIADLIADGKLPPGYKED